MAISPSAGSSGAVGGAEHPAPPGCYRAAPSAVPEGGRAPFRPQAAREPSAAMGAPPQRSLRRAARGPQRRRPDRREQAPLGRRRLRPPLGPVCDGPSMRRIVTKPRSRARACSPQSDLAAGSLATAIRPASSAKRFHQNGTAGHPISSGFGKRLGGGGEIGTASEPHERIVLSRKRPRLLDRLTHLHQQQRQHPIGPSSAPLCDWTSRSSAATRSRDRRGPCRAGRAPAGCSDAAASLAVRVADCASIAASRCSSCCSFARSDRGRLCRRPRVDRRGAPARLAPN